MNFVIENTFALIAFVYLDLLVFLLWEVEWYEAATNYVGILLFD